MPLNAQHFRRRQEVLAAAVSDGKLVHNSTAYRNFSTLFDVDPQYAEHLVARLAPNPLVGAGPQPDFLPAQDDSYDAAWLSPPERRRINEARSGVQSSHALD
jgi:hypothetical protein